MKGRFSRAGVERILAIAIFAAAVGMLGFYLCVTYRALFHSDAAMKLLLAQEMARQFTPFPRGWNYVNDIVIIFPSLIAAPLLWIFQPSFPLHAAVDVVSAGLVLYAAYVASRAVGIVGPMRWLVPTLLASSFSAEFAEAVFGQSAYSGTVFILLLVAGWGARYLGASDHFATGGHRTNIIGIAILVTAAVAGGERGLASYAGPLLMALVAFSLFATSDPATGKRAARLIGVALAATIAGAVIFAMLLKIVDFHAGAVAQKFVDSSRVVTHLRLMTRNWLELFAALPPPDSNFGAGSAVIYMGRLGFALSAFFLPIALLFRVRSIASTPLRFLVLFHASVVAVTLYVLTFSGVMVDETYGSPRYLIPLVPVSLLVCVTWLRDVALAARFSGTWIGFGVALVMLALSPAQLIGPAFSKWPHALGSLRPNRMAALTAALIDARLDHGFATYWNSSVITILSGSQVQVAPTTLSDGGLPTPFHHLTAERWYANDWAQGSTFLLLDSADSRKLNLQALDAIAGAPERTLHVAGYDILVYPFNIGQRMGFAAQRHVALDRVPATCDATYTPLDEKLVLSPSAFGAFRVEATNLSRSIWSQNSIPYFNPGLRIVDANGRGVAEFRGLLPREVAPGETVTLTVPFRAPAPGDYTLNFSFVVEGYAWCGNFGQKWAKAPLSVRP